MYNKIFFQTGAASRNDGFGKLVQECNAQGIPVNAATSDGTAMILDVQTSRQQTGIENWGNFIPTQDEFGRRFDLDYTIYPDFNTAIAAYQANAVTTWDRAERVIPPEIDKDIITISLENEQRGYVGWGSKDNPDDPEWDKRIPGFNGWADNFGYQAYYIGLEALRRGYMYFAFAFAGGNPEPGAWAQPGMLKYLRLCQDNPTRLGVALHEYSFADTLLETWGTHVGRFEMLHATCDNHGIARPRIFIKEFGWRERDIPGDAMAQLPDASALYAKYPNIIGVSIWTCQNNWGNASTKAQSMIPEVKDYTLTWRYDGEPEPPPTIPPDRLGDARVPYNRTYVRVNQSATKEEWLRVAEWAYDNRYTVGFSNDDAGIGVGLGSKKVIEVGREFDPVTIEQWYFNEYGVTDVEHRDY